MLKTEQVLPFMHRQVVRGTQNSGVYTSSLNGKNYWSLAILPLSGNVSSIANEYKKYAYVFPANTTATYVYDENTSTVRTDFNVAA